MSSQLSANNVWKSFRELPKKEREFFIMRLIKDRRMREDLMDLAVAEERRKEPSRPLEEFLKELNDEES